MKKFYLLFSFLCLFLVACSLEQSVEDRDLNALSSGAMIDDTLSGYSSKDSDNQIISSLISFDEGEYNIVGYDKWGYDKSGYNEYGYDRWRYHQEWGYDKWGYYDFLEEPRYDEWGYGLPPRKEQHYLLQRTGDESLITRANAQPVYTNDPRREIQTLELVKTDRDATSYHCFYCEPDRNAIDYNGEDNNAIFIDYVLAVPKAALATFTPLQTLGIQAVDGLVGYDEGYLILFPFKFPVDKETFATVQTKGQLQYGLDDTLPSLKEIAGEWRRPRFQNAGEIIDRYLGDDKDWVYYWTPGWAISINRVQKASDFAFISSEKKE